MVDDVFMNEIIDSMEDRFEDEVMCKPICIICGEPCYQERENETRTTSMQFRTSEEVKRAGS